jgi:hypothetical protein
MPFTFRSLFFQIIMLSGLLTLIACESNEQKGERLAKTYCSSCHVFPEPGFLNKKVWETSVLPRMGVQLGLNTFDYQMDVHVNDLITFIKTLPAAPVISKTEWEHIVQYYKTRAPDSLAIPEPEPVSELTQFDVSSFRFNQREQPLITLLHTDTLNQQLYVGTRESWLYKLDTKFAVTDSIYVSSPPSHLRISENGKAEVLLMGIMDPNDQPKGSLVNLDFESEDPIVLLDSIKRPVHFEKKDLNGDGLDDYIICAFGNYTGALLIYENQGEGKFKRIVLNGQPGTRNVIIRDFTHDGKPDILALISQADEKVMLFTNEGDFKFKPSTLVRFPSVYGSSYFEVADFNKDGHFDFVYTNGDNADFSIILKPYHGVRIFMNDGKNQFKETWFYPMHGASEVKARDFDGDGDIDIAAISFFPDFNHEPNSFLYFENNPNGFDAQTTPLAQSGRWLRMEAADIDQDGDQDLLLGALNFKPLVPDSLFSSWKQSGSAILILRNKLK